MLGINQMVHGSIAIGTLTRPSFTVVLGLESAWRLLGDCADLPGPLVHHKPQQVFSPDVMGVDIHE